MVRDMRGLFTSIVLSFALMGCVDQPTDTCSRFLVDENGAPSGSRGGGPGNVTPVGSVGVPLNLDVFAPLSSCESDSLRAQITVSDPSNLDVPFTRPEELARQSAGAVKSVLSFTPAVVGLYTVKVAFEPSLGARTVLIDVAVDGLRNSSVRVPIPTEENCTVNATWPLTDDTVACEERANGNVSITSSDGGLLRFQGEQLVVIDNVLWTVNGPLSALERRVYEDGGLTLTHTFANFPSRSTPAMHDVDLALRFRSNGRLTRVRLLPDGGTNVQELQLDGQVGPPLAYFAEANDVMFRWSQSDCSSNSCVNLSDLAGVEPGFVWRAEPRPFGEPQITPRVRGFTRPTTVSDSTPKITLLYDTESMTTPTYGFERLPLWLGPKSSTTDSARRVLISMTDAGVSMSSWPRSEVLRVGRQHLVLLDPDPGFVRVYRK